jgi:hypothetical protein
VNKYSAPVPGDARAAVMVDFDNQIIKPVGTLEAIAWFIGRPPERPIVTAIHWVLAPGIVGRYAPDRQQGARAR